MYDRLRPGIGIVELFESFSADEDDVFYFQVSMIGSDLKTTRETYSWKKPELLRYLSSNGKDCRCSVGFGGWEVNVVIDGQGKITTIEEPRNLFKRSVEDREVSAADAVLVDHRYRMLEVQLGRFAQDPVQEREHLGVRV